MPNKNIRPKKSVSTNKPSSTLVFYHFLGALQVIIMLFGIIATIYLRQLPEGTSAVGANLVFGLLFGTLGLIDLIIALVVLIGLPIYLIRHQHQYNWSTRSSVTLLVSILTILFVMGSTMSSDRKSDEAYDQQYKNHLQTEEDRRLDEIIRNSESLN